MTLRPVPDPDPPKTNKRRNRDHLATDTAAYSPDKFYTATNDADGSGVKTSVRLPLPIHAAIQRIVQQGKIPAFDTQQAFLRDAAFHRLKYLEDTGAVDGLDSTLSVMMRLSRMKARNSEIKAQREYLEEAEKSCVTAAEISDMAYLAETLQELRDELASMPRGLAAEAKAMIERWEKLTGPTGGVGD